MQGRGKRTQLPVPCPVHSASVGAGAGLEAEGLILLGGVLLGGHCSGELRPNPHLSIYPLLSTEWGGA